MPELPEVETVRRGLEKRLLNFQIKELEVCRDKSIASPGGSQIFIEKMRGTSIGSWKRRGKYLFSSLYKRLDNQSHIDWGWWAVHLRMTGHFQWHEKPISPCNHTRVRFWDQNGIELRFVDMRSFGQMWWVPPESQPAKIVTGLKKLGPEPFSNEFNSDYLKSCLKKRSRSIKASLLDQSLVAGVGNIYADETLFAAGIVPYKESSKLSKNEINKICQKLKEILQKSIKEGGTTFSDFRDLEGLNGNYGDKAWVYRRSNKPCRKCGTIIKKLKLIGRGTHWCPNCQK